MYFKTTVLTTVLKKRKVKFPTSDFKYLRIFYNFRRFPTKNQGVAYSFLAEQNWT